MSPIARAARAVWDFVVGDDPLTAFGVVVALGATALIAGAGAPAGGSCRWRRWRCSGSRSGAPLAEPRGADRHPAADRARQPCSLLPAVRERRQLLVEPVLTPREHAVLELLAEGHTNREIAAAL